MSINQNPRRFSTRVRDQVLNSNVLLELDPSTSNSLNLNPTSQEIGVCGTGPPLDTTKVNEMKPVNQNESSISTNEPNDTKNSKVTKSARVRVKKSKIGSSQPGGREIYSGVPTDEFEYSWNGWTKTILQRKKGKTKGVKDSYWFSPKYNYRFRSLASVRRFRKIYEECQDEKQAWEKLKISMNPKGELENEKKNAFLDTELKLEQSKTQETSSKAKEAPKVITKDKKKAGGKLTKSTSKKRNIENKKKSVKVELSKPQRTPSKISSKITKKNVKKKSATTVKSTRVTAKKSKIVSSVLRAKEIWSGEPTEKFEYAWEPGWTKKIFQRQRGKTLGLTDSYWYTPKLKYKLRSLAEIRKFMIFQEKFRDEEKAWNALKGRLPIISPNLRKRKV